MNNEAVFVTIDSQSTKDIDDAILIAKTEAGFHVLVAIADPTELVSIGSDIDAKAKEIAATVYTRDFTKVSMLPKEISQDAGSLVAGQKRSSFVFSFELDAELQVVSFSPSVQDITVAHRLRYEEIPLIAGDPNHSLHQQIRESVILGQSLLDGRRSKGAMALYDLKQFLLTDEEGNLLQMKSCEDTIGHILVQEMMILTNSLLGQYLVKNNIPAIYRNHEVTLAAPAQLELRQTIEALLFASDDNKDVATSKLQTLLGKAKYEPTLKGHYGLNLPVYTHGTSPLRRFADLVNLRQLKCFLAGKSFSYDQAQLGEICEHINTVIQERKEASSEHFKSVVSKQADQMLTSGALGKMDDMLLTMAIKNVMNSTGVNGILAQEIIKRLERNAVENTVTDRLFFEVDRKMLAEPLAQAMTNWLIENPMKSMALANHGLQIGQVASLDFETHTSPQGFTSKAVLKLSTGDVYTGVFSNPKKKIAEQLAAGSALLAAKALPAGISCTQSTSPSSDAKPAAALPFNAKGALFELCTKHKIQSPAFSFESQGPGHQVTFRSTAKMTVNGSLMEATSPWSESKKGAEGHAANQLLSQVQERLKSMTTAGPAKGSKNPVGDLQEFAAKNGLRLPEYSFSQLSQTPPLFECQIHLSHGNGVTAKAQANSKAESKKQAALKALSAL
jgi:ribonuclease R